MQSPTLHVRRPHSGRDGAAHEGSNDLERPRLGSQVPSWVHPQPRRPLLRIIPVASCESQCFQKREVDYMPSLFSRGS